jgi:hypothetical protein
VNDTPEQPVDGQPTETPEAQAAAPNPPPAPGVVYTHERFAREIWIDSAIRRALAVVAVVALIGLVLFDRTGTMLGLAVVMVLVFAWIGISMIGANVWRSLPGVTAMIGRDPAAAEAHLAALMKRRPVMRWVRLLLYHRLAAIRHRQHKFAESAAICRSVLSEPLGPARRQRASLLLMLAEASLQCRDLHGAYAALCDLQGERLGLAERLQRLAIQTRYEVLAGHDRAALHGVRQKLLMAELMPAEHCGAMHAMLTASAKRAGKHELADWLWRRSELLVGREQLDRLIRGAFAIGVVGPPEG